MNADEKKALGERVAALRRAKGLKQSELADQAGISTNTVINLENGHTMPQAPTRRAIARVLGEDVFDEESASRTRELWPPDVAVFVDVLGQYLASLDSGARAAQVSRWMAEIMGTRK